MELLLIQISFLCMTHQSQLLDLGANLRALPNHKLRKVTKIITCPVYALNDNCIHYIIASTEFRGGRMRFVKPGKSDPRSEIRTERPVPIPHPTPEICPPESGPETRIDPN